jgi:hypothetical protein
LTKKGNFDYSLIDEGVYLFQNINRRAIFLDSPQRWNYAKGAGVVAANGNGDPRCKWREPARRQCGWEMFKRFQYLDL